MQLHSQHPATALILRRSSTSSSKPRARLRHFPRHRVSRSGQCPASIQDSRSGLSFSCLPRRNLRIFISFRAPITSVCPPLSLVPGTACRRQGFGAASYSSGLIECFVSSTKRPPPQTSEREGAADQCPCEKHFRGSGGALGSAPCPSPEISVRCFSTSVINEERLLGREATLPCMALGRIISPPCQKERSGFHLAPLAHASDRISARSVGIRNSAIMNAPRVQVAAAAAALEFQCAESFLGSPWVHP